MRMMIIIMMTASYIDYIRCGKFLSRRKHGQGNSRSWKSSQRRKQEKCLRPPCSSQIVLFTDMLALSSLKFWLLSGVSEKPQRGSWIWYSKILQFVRACFPHFISTESVLCAVKGRVYKTSKPSTLILVMVMIMMFVWAEVEKHADAAVISLLYFSLSGLIFGLYTCKLDKNSVLLAPC